MPISSPPSKSGKRRLSHSSPSDSTGKRSASSSDSRRTPPGIEIGGMIAAMVELELMESNGMRKIDLDSSIPSNARSPLLGKIRQSICEPTDHSRPGSFIEVRLGRKDDGRLAIYVNTSDRSFVESQLTWMKDIKAKKDGRAYRISVNNHLPVEQNRQLLEKIGAALKNTMPTHAFQVGMHIVRNTLTINNPTKAVQQILDQCIREQDVQRSR